MHPPGQRQTRCAVAGTLRSAHPGFRETPDGLMARVLLVRPGLHRIVSRFTGAFPRSPVAVSSQGMGIGPRRSRPWMRGRREGWAERPRGRGGFPGKPREVVRAGPGVLEGARLKRGGL